MFLCGLISFLFIFKMNFFFIFKIILFIYFDCWVFAVVRELPLVAVSGGQSSSWRVGLIVVPPRCGAQSLGAQALVVAARRLSS